MANDLDLAAASFVALRRSLGDERGRPHPFTLQPKASTQDDPFDVYLSERLEEAFPGRVQRAPGPLISPDIVVLAAGLDPDTVTALDTTDACGIEVKRFERLSSRVTGMDFNTTPPCGTIRVYSSGFQKIEIPGFYAFAVVEMVNGQSVVTTLALVDGDAINNDKALYDLAVSPRTKEIDLGSYGDGMNRQRPMYVFPNPLSWDWLGGKIALIHRRADLSTDELVRVAKIERKVPARTAETAGTGDEGLTEVTSGVVPAASSREFHCYVIREDASRLGFDGDVVTQIDPFRVPTRRVTATSQRGRFILRRPA
jgi:hypothetical protein